MSPYWRQELHANAFSFSGTLKAEKGNGLKVHPLRLCVVIKPQSQMFLFLREEPQGGNRDLMRS